MTEREEQATVEAFHKSPIDLWTYQEILWETKPDLLIETGTSGGGSASYFAHIFDILNHGQIMTVDTVGYPLPMCPEHPRIEYLRGSSVDLDIAERIQEVAHDKRTMVSLDSLHTYKHVAREIELYAPLVSSGCYLVVEDTGMGGFQSDWCSRAVSELLARDSSFSVDLSREKHLFTSNHNGWLRKQ